VETIIREEHIKMAEVLTNFMDVALPYIKILGFIFIGGVLVIGGMYYIMVVMKQRKWKIEVHEQKTDGKLHTVGYDTLIEKKRNFGTKTIYFLKKSKQECIPPPSIITDRYKGKEEVDYLRIDRELIPAKKSIKNNYTKPENIEKVARVYDKILLKIRETKTTLFDSEPVRNRWLYVPVHKTLTIDENYEPIPYDMSMLAVNEINNADEFFKSKYEFWSKYGPVIVWGLTIVFLIIMAVLTYDYLTTIANESTGQVTNLLQRVSEGVGATAPAS